MDIIVGIDASLVAADSIVEGLRRAHQAKKLKMTKFFVGQIPASVSVQWVINCAGDGEKVRSDLGVCQEICNFLKTIIRLFPTVTSWCIAS